jgi:hypothetical protein
MGSTLFEPTLSPIGVRRGVVPGRVTWAHDPAWPNSIFMSLDGVAIDSVGFDVLTSEWPDLVDITNAYNYLREPVLPVNESRSD